MTFDIKAPDFDLEKTLNSGQVFHWEKIDNGFVGTIGEVPVFVEQRGGELKVCRGETPRPAGGTPTLPEMVAHYFALDHSLPDICVALPKDPAMQAARKFCRGLRIIRQPKWECLATFICSSMKQVAHIRQISRALRERFGEECTISGVVRRLDGVSPHRSINYSVFTFPSAERIARSSEAQLRGCRLGYRAKNLLATARLVTRGDVDLESMSRLADVDLRAALGELPGVGAKVANCVMLFAYERLRAFPIDVWIERVLREQYFRRKRNVTPQRLSEFTESYFGEHGGYAQQYLFHYARMFGGRRAVGARKQDATARVPPACGLSLRGL